MQPLTYQRERRRLGARLRQLREDAGISGNQFATRHGWVQPRVSRIETGKQLPTDDDLAAWAGLAGAGPEVREELAAMLRHARAEYASWQESYRESGGAAAAQAAIKARERDPQHLRIFQPAMIPGLLQTPAYARELLQVSTGPTAFGADEDDLAEMAEQRMRRQEILYRTDKRIEVVVMEAALRSRLCSEGTLTGQLDRLVTASSGVAALELRVLPFETPLPIYPLSGFTMLDDELVIIETMSGEQQLSSDDDIAYYARCFDLLRDAAVSGREAVGVIQRSLEAVRHTGTREPPESTSREG